MDSSLARFLVGRVFTLKGRIPTLLLGPKICDVEAPFSMLLDAARATTIYWSLLNVFLVSPGVSSEAGMIAS